MAKTNRAVSLLLWVSISTRKFIESYFFLTLSFRDPSFFGKFYLPCNRTLNTNCY